MNRPSILQMALCFSRLDHLQGRIYVPQVQWVKDYPGQVTNGRIGRPAIVRGPVDWLPLRECQDVLEVIRRIEGRATA